MLFSAVSTSIPVFAEEKQNADLLALEADIAVDDSGKMEYIVSSDNEAELENFVEKGGGEIIDNSDNYAVIALSDDEREELSTNSPFIIEPNVMLTAEGEEESAINTVVNDKWNIKAISADVDNSDEIDTVKVAVIDSGVDYGEDIKIAQSVSLIDDETKGFDVTGHGTAVEGIIGASDNGIGTTGVAPGEEIYSIKVLDDDNRVPVSRIIEALYWCIENKINIVNLSMGMPYDSTSLRSTINACTKEGILIVASAGNAGNGGSVLYPRSIR